MNSSAKFSQIRNQNEQDQHNFGQAMKMLGYTGELPDEVCGLYDLHSDATAQFMSSPAATDSDRWAGALYAVCRKHLVTGTTSLFRLSGSQMFKETRSAVDTAGIAGAIRRDPTKFAILMRDDGGVKARRAVKGAFTSTALFPFDSGPPPLRQIFDTASQMSHANAMTFLRRLRDSGKPGIVKVSVQDIQRDDVHRELPALTVWLCGAHLAILEAADSAFKGVDGDFSVFRKERKYLADKVRRFRQKHGGFGVPKILESRNAGAAKISD